MAQGITKQKKNETVQSPRLRFSGFTDPWKLKPFRQLLVLTERPFKMDDDGVYSLIKVRRGNNGVVSRGLFEGRKVLVKAQFKVDADDFVISKRQIVHQACGIVPKELAGSIVSNEYNVFKPSAECCIRYFDYLTYRPQMRHAFFLSCVGVHLEKMLFKTNDWLKRKFNFPYVEEQRKIAAFLTAVDGRIAQLSQKKALLEDYKKGVMQQLFTQAIRFKDDHGNEFPDWDEKTLGELSIKVGSGKTPKGGRLVYQTSGIKFIRSQNVTDNCLDLSEVTFISEAINAEMKGTEVSPLDVLLNITGASIGRSCVVPKSFDRGNVNQHVCIIRPDKGALNPIYLQIFLSSGFGQKLIDQGQSGSGREGLNFQSIRAFTLPIPSLPEQTKIANFLTALDRKIESVAQQITHTQAFKKGLLQQMFV